MKKGEKENIENKYAAFGIVSTFFLMAGCIVFSVLCINNTKISFIQKFSILYSLLASIVFIVLYFLSILFLLKGKDTLYKTGLTLFIAVLFCLILCFIFLKTGFFEIISNEQSLKVYLEKSGAWMSLFFILLQYFQVVLLPIPGIVSTLAGVALFGPLKALIFSLIGILLGSFTAFFIGRKLGNKAVSWLVGKDTLQEWQKKLKGKDNFVLSLMFLLPMFPDDILCFIAGLSSMSEKYFSSMIVVTRILAVTVNCYSINLIPLNTWWGLLIWGILLAGLIAAFIWIYKNLDKIQERFSKWYKKVKVSKRKNKNG